jgi:hypothetical protein
MGAVGVDVPIVQRATMLALHWSVQLEEVSPGGGGKGGKYEET